MFLASRWIGLFSPSPPVMQAYLSCLLLGSSVSCTTSTSSPSRLGAGWYFPLCPCVEFRPSPQPANTLHKVTATALDLGPTAILPGSNLTFPLQCHQLQLSESLESSSVPKLLSLYFCLISPLFSVLPISFFLHLI